MNKKTFEGATTALITPFHQGKVCFQSLDKMIDMQLNAGIDAVVVMGTTGESPTINELERVEVIDFIKERVSGKCKLIVGTGAYSTAKTLTLSQEAEAVGADAIMIVAPFYNKPSQEGLYQHFATVAERIKLPTLLYSHPKRCGIQIEIETIVRLRKDFPHICGLKDCGGNLEQVSEMRSQLDDDFVILTGDDGLTLPYMSVGAHGVVSIAANYIPSEIVELVRLARENDFQGAREIHARHYKLFRDQCIEPNPVPIKYAMHLNGIISSPEVRLPLCEMSEFSKEQMDKTLEISACLA